MSLARDLDYNIPGNYVCAADFLYTPQSTSTDGWYDSHLVTCLDMDDLLLISVLLVDC